MPIPPGADEYPFEHHSSNPLQPFLTQEGEDEDITEEPVHLASAEEKKRRWWRNAVLNVLFIASWFFFATVLSVYNKWMFSDKHMNFKFPLFVTTLHMFVQFALSAVLRVVWPHHFRPEKSPQLEDYGKKVVPTAVATSLDVGLSNFSLKTISLSFYTMCKSSSLIFVLLFAFFFKLETFSWRLVGVIFLICAGVLLMVATETHFVLQGFLLVISASALGGLRWGLTQLLLRNKKLGLDNPAATIFWMSPTMGISLAVISAVIEGWGAVIHSGFFATLPKALETIFYLMAPGVVAFCMVMSEFYIIQRTGMVPMSIAGIAKEVTTITISAWFFGDELTPLNITGVAVTVCGIVLFTYHKYRKSIDSPVPLDAHGNPILSDEEFLDGDRGQHVLLGDSLPLTMTRGSGEFHGVRLYFTFEMPVTHADRNTGHFFGELPPIVILRRRGN
ncbi:triose-phosphate transporter family-domain-containing protein [Desarmillaria tabescens]|uniref:Triose-phosphate transporter family-domain-containing protein n=1 Tax=Armillaria tabescens TaxID=1929756 RepID=A0AA39TR09_ARMTA|nr:triose-phosphate transporter family-domain-containing protein [Desarmillaria tabescens]KAK0461009.1 triose-phosphate transporter family-domain-containing protein [Desarmillaria tabescens]